MAVVAGIDEAGYGPLLGPLVISAAAFRLPEEHAAADLWKLLRIGRPTAKRKPRAGVRVGDSKLLHRGPNGLRNLEENLLPFLQLLEPAPQTFQAFVGGFCGAVSHESYAWYSACDLKLPRQANLQRVADRAVQLRRALHAARAEFILARAFPMHAGEFNRAVLATGNKADALARALRTLLTELHELYAGEDLFIRVDRQGGRTYYENLLSEAFPDCEISIEEESNAISTYCIAGNPGRMQIAFAVRGDATHLPTALGSMLSKYTRELYMELLNAFWSKRVPGVKRTAGYFGDGRRFYEDIRHAVEADGLDPALILRSR